MHQDSTSLPTLTATDLLVALRQETGRLHQALHKHPIMEACQAGTLSLPDYIKMLKAFHRPLKALSQNISAVPVDVLKMKIMARLNAIDQDLYTLGIDRAILDASFSDRAITSDEALGMCYVLIGSSMGAATLAASIQSTLGEVPRAYLSMSPKEAGWPELLAYIRPRAAQQHPTSAKAALATFQWIESELNKEANSNEGTPIKATGVTF